MDKSFQKILRVSGIVLVVMGALIMWRGIGKMIPVTGIVNGGLFTLGGVFVLVVGLLLLFAPTVSARKKAKKEKEEAKLREKIMQEIRDKK